MESCFIEKNENAMRQLCVEGLKGKHTLPIKEVEMPLTNVCNCYCIMCLGSDKDCENHSSNNEPHFFVSLEEYKKILPTPKNKRGWLFKKTKEQPDKISFLFASGETLLNKNLYEILKYTKSIYPNSSIRLISNGTIPPCPEDIVKYIDRIGFSVDGCTSQTFEKIRTPAKFDHVLNVIKKWDEAADKYNDSLKLVFSTVVSTENIHELGGIVRLASNFKHLDSIYIQQIVILENKSHLNYMLLSNLDRDIIISCVDEAKIVSDEVKVRIDNINAILPCEYQKENNDRQVTRSKFCRYPWNGILPLTETGEFRYFCCYMSKEQTDELKQKYQIPSNLPISEVYNSHENWKFRQDLLDGKLIDYCLKCTQCEASYNILCEKEVDMDEYFYF